MSRITSENTWTQVLIAALPFRSHRKVKLRFEESLGKGIITTIAIPQRLQVVLQWLEDIRLTRKLKKVKIDLLICRNARDLINILSFFQRTNFTQSSSNISRHRA